MSTVDEHSFAVDIDQKIRSLTNEVSLLKTFCLILASEAEMYKIPFDWVHKTNPDSFDWTHEGNTYTITDVES